MKILLYDYQELEERASKHLKVWKAWHMTLYIFAAIFGMMNYVFLVNTMSLVDDHCILHPIKLEFHWVELPHNTDAISRDTTNYDLNKSTSINSTVQSTNNTISESTAVPEINKNITEKRDKAETVKREANGVQEFTSQENETSVNHTEGTIITSNKTHRLMLDTMRSFFDKDTTCHYSEYMPLLSTICAILWTTFFIMCPSGGQSRTGLQKPWRILTPALLFALILVGLTGHSFTSTNGGLQAFCADFHNYTNATTCSSVNPFIQKSWNGSWGIGGRIAATRAAAAGVWVSWACAAALLLARCLTAPDFTVRRTGVYLIRDPKQKVTPYLLKNSNNSQRSPRASPNKRDTTSIRSEPTITTEMVTASVDHGPESDPTSLATTPVKEGTALEMSHYPGHFGDRR